MISHVVNSCNCICLRNKRRDVDDENGVDKAWRFKQEYVWRGGGVAAETKTLLEFRPALVPKARGVGTP